MGAFGSWIVSFVSFLLFFPCLALSNSAWGYREAGAFYVSGAYKPASPLVGDVTIVDDFGGTVEVSPLYRQECADIVGSCGKIDEVRFDRHGRLASSGDYLSSFGGVAVVAGYDIGGTRVELELQTEKFDIDRGFFGPKFGDKHRYSLARRVGLRDDTVPAKKKGVLTLVNNGIRLISSVASMCRDVDVGLLFVPHLCGGFGIERAEAYGAVTSGVVYQIKGGVTYKLSSRVSGFVALFYRAMQMGDESEFSVPLSNSRIHVEDGVERSKVIRHGVFIDPVIRMGIAYYGVEIGLRFGIG